MYLHCKGLGHHVVQLTFLVALILDQIAFRVFNLAGSLTLFLLLSFCIDRPFRFSIYFFIYFCIILFYFIAFFFFFFFYIGMQKKRLHLEAPSCKVLYDSIKIVGHIEVVPFQLESRLLRRRPSSAHTGPHRSRKTFLCDQAWPGCVSSRLGCLLQRLWV